MWDSGEFSIYGKEWESMGLNYITSLSMMQTRHDSCMVMIRVMQHIGIFFRLAQDPGIATTIIEIQGVLLFINVKVDSYVLCDYFTPL